MVSTLQFEDIVQQIVGVSKARLGGAIDDYLRHLKDLLAIHRQALEGHGFAASDYRRVAREIENTLASCERTNLNPVPQTSMATGGLELFE